MKIKCLHCETVIEGKVVGQSDDAIAETINGLTDHVQAAHLDLWKQYQDSVAEITKAIPALYTWMIFNGFIDLEEESPTSKVLKESYDELDESIDPFYELFDSNSPTEEEEKFDPTKMQLKQPSEVGKLLGIAPKEVKHV